MQAAETSSCPIVFPAGIAPRGSDAALLVRQLMRLGIRWELGAKGPDAYDCWSLSQLVQFHLFGRVVHNVDLAPDATTADIIEAVARHPAHRQWRLHDGPPAHGDAVKMGNLQNPLHIGTFLAIDRGMVLHLAEHAGICCDTLTELRQQGYRNLRFNRFTGEAA